MKNEYLTAVLTSSILACSISQVWGQDETASEITFSCEDNNGTPITIARNREGKTETIFYWKEEVLNSKVLPQVTPERLCNDVSIKLNSWAEEGYELLPLSFVATHISELPVICLSSTPRQCRKVLVILNQSEQPNVINNNTLEAILNPEIINNQKIPRERRHLYTGHYYIDLFQ